MKSPRRPPRRRKPSTGARLRPFWILIAVVALVLGGAIAASITWPGFSPDRIVVTGNRVVPAAEIVRRARIAPHVNMWLQDPNAIARRIESIPYVAGVRVRRLPPRTIEIAVAERKPFAVLFSASDAAVVDRELRVLAPADPFGDPQDLPRLTIGLTVALAAGSFVTDPGAQRLRDDYFAMIGAHVIPLELHYDRFNGLVATVRGGVRVLLGDDADLSRKLALIDPILSQIAGQQRRIASIDLRAPNTPVVVYR